MEREPEHFSIQALAEYPDLAGDWLSLEARGTQSFFLSWTWISSWLSAYSPKVDVLSVRDGHELVGLCLLVRHQFSSLKRFSSYRLHIHQTGLPAQDQIWTEYNSVLCASGYENTVLRGLMPFLIKNYPGWDEFLIGAISKEVASLVEKSSELKRLDLWQSPSYGVQLDKLAQTNVQFLDSISRNSRYQINRSLKLYDELGGFRLEFAKSEKEALAFFQEVSPLHQQKWGAGPGESGFANPEFVKFHESLIQKGFQLGQIDLIKLYVGDRVLGYLYNFLYQGRVYFYLSGLVTEEDAKLKPGLCAHALAIQYYMDKGFVFYDFMGGNDRYKANLGCVHDELFHIALQKPLLKFKIESVLRRLKRYFKS